MGQRVVVTGLGYLSALGFGPEDHEPALRAGRSAAAPITRFDTKGFRTANGGQCDERRLETELLGRGIGQYVADSLCDRRPVSRHENTTSTPQLLHDMNTHVFAFM